MNTGNSVRDAGPRRAANAEGSMETLQDPVAELRESADVTTLPGGEARGAGERAAQTPRSFQHIQDIQELIDKLAAVTDQLRHPGHS
jgi:hypothetical protein